MIIEFAGLPGAGKTTICRNISVPHGGKGSVSRLQLQLTREWWSAACNVFLLALVARPLTTARLKRAINLAVFLRHYQRTAKTIVLDQGQVQKIWSLLVDVPQLPEKQLERTLKSLTPLAPQCVVWVETPVEDAVKRITERTHGNSRYDEMQAEDAILVLTQRLQRLRRIYDCYCETTGSNGIELDGKSAPAEGARKVETLIS